MDNKNIPGEESQSLLEKLNKVIAKPNYSGLYGITIEKGKGCNIIDADGNEYLDCLAAASTNGLGYGNEDIISAYTNAALNMQHSCFIYSPNKYALALAQKLIDITPGDFEKCVMLGLSGSDACDGAIKAARRYTKIQGVIHFKNDYHGSTGLSMPASDFSDLNDGLFKQGKLFHELNFPKDKAEAQLVLNHIEELFKMRLAGAIIAEAIQGDAGINIPPEGFYQGISELTAKYDAVFIVDEIQSGMGRTGEWWAVNHFKVVPDILITAKGLSAGYAPISAVIGRKDIINSLDHAQHVFTYSGHAPSAAVAFKVIKEIEDKNLVKQVADNGQYLIEKLKDIQTDYPEYINQVRGLGFMIGVEINNSNDELRSKIIATRCVEKGLYVGFFGVNGEVIRIEPPYIISKIQLDQIIKTLTEVLQEVKDGSIPDYTISNIKKFSLGL